MEKLIINFDFEEVNSAVFRNAQLYLRFIKNGKRDVSVIVPEVFYFLFSNAFKLYVIPDSVLKSFGIIPYYNISNDLNPNFKSFRIRIKIKIYKIFSFLSNFLTFNIFFLSKMNISLRQQKYYVDSGLENYALSKIRILNKLDSVCDINYLRVNHDFDVTLQKFIYSEILIFFRRNFEYLYQSIVKGFFYYTYMHHYKVLEHISKSDKNINFQIIQNAFNSNNVVIIRTRNFLNKQPVHNSNYNIFFNFTQELLKLKFVVLNLGFPLLKLNIFDDNYFEINESISFEQELSLCQGAHACIMSAQAGLFSAFSATKIRLVQIDDEWTKMVNINISLVEARNLAGLETLVVKDLIDKLDFISSAKRIYECNRDISEISSDNFYLPQIEYLR